jgi:Porin PorA
VKRSKVGLVLIIIGALIVALAPIWKWGVGPMLLKIPDTIDTVSYYEGVLTLYVDPSSLSPLPEEMAVKVPLQITRTDKSAPERSSGDVAVIKETQLAKGPGGKAFVDVTKYYALDRKTAENVTSDEADVKDREGYSILLGFYVDKDGTYPIWDDDTRTTGDLEFVEETTLDGYTSKDVPAIVWRGSGKEPTVGPVLGLPAEVSGAMIKSLLNNPALPFGDTDMYPIQYVKSTDATVITGIKVGQFLSVPNYKEDYFIDASEAGLGEIKIATLEYGQTPASIKTSTDEGTEAYGLLDAVGIYIPLGLLIVGLIILVIGLILFLRKKEA